MDSIVKLVYQNGEFIDKESSFLGISLDTIFTVLTTIGIFIVGIIIERWIESRKEKRRLKELEEYFIKLIEMSEKSVLKQANGFKEFADKLLEKKDQHFYLIDVSAFSMKPMKEIETKDLFAIYVKNKKGDVSSKTELFRKLRGNIEHMDNIKLTYKKAFRDFMNKYQKFEKEYQGNIKLTSEAYDSFRTDNEANKVPLAKDRFLLTLDKIRSNWAGLEREGIDYRDAYVAKDYYIDSVRELCRKSIGDRRAVYILKYIVDGAFAFDNIVELKSFYSKHFKLDYESLKSSMDEIKDCLKQFEKM